MSQFHIKIKKKIIFGNNDSCTAVYMAGRSSACDVQVYKRVIRTGILHNNNQCLSE